MTSSWFFLSTLTNTKVQLEGQKPGCGLHSYGSHGKSKEWELPQRALELPVPSLTRTIIFFARRASVCSKELKLKSYPQPKVIWKSGGMPHF